nr:MAG TPA: RNA polymerase sigma factor [Caudoviricetes sp.]
MVIESKQYFIYYRATNQKIPVVKEVHDAFYKQADRIRHKEQYHGRCMCPHKYIWKCDGDCLGCEYQATGNISSLDQHLSDGEGTLSDYIADTAPSMEDICADRDLLVRLMERFREIDPDADRIIQMRLENPKISDRKIAETLGRPQRTFSDQMKRCYKTLRSEQED